MFNILRLNFSKLDQFAYSEVQQNGKSVCVQIGTHGDAQSAEIEQIASGGPTKWTPGVCPSQYSLLDYGTHVLSAGQ